MHMIEADWKKFKQVREVALERLSQRILDECKTVCGNAAPTAHEKYPELYDLIHKRDKDIASAFNDFRRSTAALCLLQIVRQGLVTEEELSRFSPDVQHPARLAL